jgi:hypothetical protein
MIVIRWNIVSPPECIFLTVCSGDCRAPGRDSAAEVHTPPDSATLGAFLFLEKWTTIL